MIPSTAPFLTAACAARPGGFELRFEALFQPGRALAFPCDPTGHVDLDGLSERARCNYFYARAVIGREFAHPTVVGTPDASAARH